MTREEIINMLVRIEADLLHLERVSETIVRKRQALYEDRARLMQLLREVRNGQAPDTHREDT